MTNTALENIKNQIKPNLKKYLEQHGVKFENANGGRQFHCFNASAHNHGDKDASASLTLDGQGYKCFTCGVTGDIFTACGALEGRELNGAGFIGTVKHLAGTFGVDCAELGKPAEKPKKTYVKQTEYVYTDEKGAPLYKIERHVNTENPKDKIFFPHVFNAEAGEYARKAGFSDNCPRVLYRLPEVCAAIERGDYIFLTEGEKCADIARELGITATCISGGAKAWNAFAKKYTRQLFDAKVIILPDNDYAGRGFADDAAKSLSQVADVRVVSLPGLPEKGDIEQWLKLGGNKEQLLKFVAETKPFNEEDSFDKEESAVFEFRGAYWRQGRNEREMPHRITNFVLRPLICFVTSGEHFYRFKVIVSEPQRLELELDASANIFSSTTKFMETFCDRRLEFTGSLFDLQKLKTMIAWKQYDEKIGVEYAGIHKIDGELIFVGAKGDFKSDGKSTGNAVLTPGKDNIKYNLEDVDIITKTELEELLPDILGFNTPDKVGTILGYMTACVFKAHLTELDFKVPYLFMFGEAGSGKTETCENVIKPFFGLRDSYSCSGLTPFALRQLCASSNTAPLILEEYKPSKLAADKKVLNMISGLLRDAYNEISGGRGTINQTVVSPHYRAPITVIGEENITETALNERSLEIQFGKRDFTDENTGHFKKLCTGKDKVTKLGKGITCFALAQTPDYINNIMNRVADKIDLPLSARTKQNLAVCHAGLTLFWDFAESFDADIDSVITLKSLMKAAAENIKHTAESVKNSSLDNTIALLDRMAYIKELTERADYRIEYSKRFSEIVLYLNPYTTWDKMTKYHGERHLSDDVILDRRTFKAVFEKSAYWLNSSYVVKFASPNGDGTLTESVRVFVFSIDKLNATVNLNVFKDKRIAEMADEDDGEPPKNFTEEVTQGTLQG